MLKKELLMNREQSIESRQSSHDSLDNKDVLRKDALRLALVMHLIGQDNAPNQNHPKYAGLPYSKLKRVLDYIQTHLDCDISIVDLSNLAGLSSFHFSRLFQRSMGITPYQYVLQQRIERAKDLLLQGRSSIADVAIESGFASQSHLSFHFKRLVGVTPKVFSRRC